MVLLATDVLGAVCLLHTSHIQTHVPGYYAGKLHNDGKWGKHWTRAQCFPPTILHTLSAPGLTVTVSCFLIFSIFCGVLEIAWTTMFLLWCKLFWSQFFTLVVCFTLYTTYLPDHNLSMYYPPNIVFPLVCLQTSLYMLISYRCY